VHHKASLADQSVGSRNKGGVYASGLLSSGNDDHLCAFKPVHFCEQLVRVCFSFTAPPIPAPRCLPTASSMKIRQGAFSFAFKTNPAPAEAWHRRTFLQIPEPNAEKMVLLLLSDRFS